MARSPFSTHGNLARAQDWVHAKWRETVAIARVRPEALKALPKRPKLLGSSTKVEKGEGAGYLTGVIYMSPSTEAFAPGDGRTLCPHATPACSAACLGNQSGRMIFAPMLLSRLWKSALFLGNRAQWRALLHAEIRLFTERARRAGLKPAIRIDGASDTGQGAYAASIHPGVQFYDYTKDVRRAEKYVQGAFAPNYHVTLSYSGVNAEACARLLASGGHVAAVFDTPRGAQLPTTWQGFPVIDADETDLRFLDPKGSVAGLRFKQVRNRAAALQRAIAGGFVIRT